MQLYNPEDLYRLGVALAPLQSLPDTSVKIGTVWHTFFQVVTALNKFRESTELHVSPACRTSSETLSNTLHRHYWDSEANTIVDSEKEIHNFELYWIKQLATEFETHFKGDCMEQCLYSIPQVQAYDTRTLLEEGEKLLSPDVIPKLRQFDAAWNDTRLAARSLAFDLWTATGFHIARATELLIQEFWKNERSKPLPQKGQRTWVNLCREMQGKAAAASKPAIPGVSDQKLVSFLLLLGDDYRNPLVHPEHSLSQTDGTMLLEGCIAAMTKILIALP